MGGRGSGNGYRLIGLALDKKVVCLFSKKVFIYRATE